MIFKKCELIENKLSEKISDKNPLKNKLIEMETPKNKSPIYSFFSFGLLTYIWLFLLTLIYKQANEIGYALFSVIFTNICFFLVYKRTYLTSGKKNLKISIINIATFLLSIALAISHKDSFSFHKIADTFLFFLEINNKSYIAISVLSFIFLGIGFSYLNSPYEAYRILYSSNCKYSKNDINRTISQYFILCIFMILMIIPIIHLVFNAAEGNKANLLKNLALNYFLFIFPLTTIIFQAKNYLNTFKKAQKIDNS
ncbi:MAG: hypothetical protein PHE89_04685 [Alphaproteobacteria bacterium]|nr:hypothetical protein [Alphaproteobacteria bacterium]